MPIVNLFNNVEIHEGDVRRHNFGYPNFLTVKFEVVESIPHKKHIIVVPMRMALDSFIIQDTLERVLRKMFSAVDNVHVCKITSSEKPGYSNVKLLVVGVRNVRE